MAKLITAPDEYLPGRDEVSIFLAGGITGCPKWQKEVYEGLKSILNLVVYNPRRDDFDIGNKDMSKEQIRWEHKYLNQADMISIWFPDCKDSVCPITLYELGYWVNTDKEIIVGAEEDYDRLLDLKVQLDLAGYKGEIEYSSVDEFISDVRSNITEIQLRKPRS